MTKLDARVVSAGNGFVIKSADGTQDLAGCSTISDVCDWLREQCPEPLKGEVLRPDDGPYPRVVASQVEDRREKKDARGWFSK